MNQVSVIPLGRDASVLAGYAFSANDVLGNLDLVFENNGSNTAYIQLRQYDGVSSPSGYVNLGNAFTIVGKGVTTKSIVVLSQKLGIFGSGNTTVNASTVLRNKSDRRGAQIDIVTTGRKAWGFDKAFDIGAFQSPGIPPVL